MGHMFGLMYGTKTMSGVVNMALLQSSLSVEELPEYLNTTK